MRMKRCGTRSARSWGAVKRRGGQANPQRSTGRLNAAGLPEYDFVMIGGWLTCVPPVSIHAMLNTCLRCLVLCLAVVVATGCAFTYPVKQEVLPQHATAALIQPWPLSVGLYIPPAVRSRVFAQQAWRVPVGEPAASNFQWTLERMFARVVVLDAPPIGQALPDGLNGVVELSDMTYEFAQPESLRYEVGLYSATGERVDGWLITTTLPIWDVEASGLSSLMMNRGTELAYAMRDVSAQFMVHFAGRPAVQAWLAGRGDCGSGGASRFQRQRRCVTGRTQGFAGAQSRHLAVYRRCARDGLRGQQAGTSEPAVRGDSGRPGAAGILSLAGAIDRAEVARRSAALGRRARYPQQDAGDRCALSAGIPWRHENRNPRRRDSLRRWLWWRGMLRLCLGQPRFRVQRHPP